MSNISWKLGMFLGPVLSGILTESVGYYLMNVMLGMVFPTDSGFRLTVIAIPCLVMGVATYLALWRT